MNGDDDMVDGDGCKQLCELLKAAIAYEEAAEKAKDDYTGGNETVLDALESACDAALQSRNDLQQAIDGLDCECEDESSEPGEEG